VVLEIVPPCTFPVGRRTIAPVVRDNILSCVIRTRLRRAAIDGVRIEIALLSVIICREYLLLRHHAGTYSVKVAECGISTISHELLAWKEFYRIGGWPAPRPMNQMPFYLRYMLVLTGH
jgi:hypothetical protein